MAGKSGSKRRPREIALKGRLITNLPGPIVAENFTSLQNLRYRDTHPRGVAGMTKINTSVMNATYLKPRSMFHFRKDQPSESHVLVQAYNTGLTASQILRNDTAIPSAGNFSATAQWTDGSGAGLGHFSDAPQGQVVYTNGVESLIWGGDEARLRSFIHFQNDDSTVLKEYTQALIKTDTDADGLATLNLAGTGPAIDANVMLLLNCDGADGHTTFTDTSPTTPHTVTANGNAQGDTAKKKFGTASALFDGTGDYLSIPDNADFDFSGGTWTIDLWMKPNKLPTSGVEVLYYHGTDASNYFQIDWDTSGFINLTIVAGGTPVVSMTSSVTFTIHEGWIHLAVQENGDTYRIYKNGVKRAEVSDVSRPANYTGSVYIGADSSGTNPYNGWLDEIRVSNAVRYSSDFTPPSTPYSGSSTTITSFYIGSTRPLEAFKLTVGTANTATNTMTVYYWDGTGWATVTTLSDGTASGGVSLAQTGTVTFDDTSSVAEIKEINGVFLYWYKVEITPAVDATTTLSQVTIRPSWQTIKDIWDGVDRPVAIFLTNRNGVYQDYSIQVFENTYDSQNTATYATISPSGDVLLSTEYMYLGFSERLMGLFIGVVEDQNNGTADTGMTVEYWNGSAWTGLSQINDGTALSNISLSKSGFVTWVPPAKEDEFKYPLIDDGNIHKALANLYPNASESDISFVLNNPGSPQTEELRTLIAKLTRTITNQRQIPPLYFYRVSFSKDLSADVQLYYGAGIPAPNPPSGYQYSFQADNRQWLINRAERDKNSVRICAENAPDVWNGEDTTEFFFGTDEACICGESLYIRTADSFITIKVIFKNGEMWGISGKTPATYNQFRISGSIGCPAPETLRTVHFKDRDILIWQGTEGLYIYDGFVVTEISQEISNIFEDGTINASKLGDSYGFVDELRKEYHWLWSSDGSTLNQEYVYDLKRSQPSEGVNKWFVMNRGTGLAIQAGCGVRDTNGKHYIYGGIDTGYMERLENGTDFDGTAIAHVFQLGDIALYEGSIMFETELVRIKLTQMQKNASVHTLNGTHYGDTNQTGTAFTLDPAKSGYDVADNMKAEQFGNHVFHKFKFSMSTSDETIGFEPMFLGLWYTVRREDLI